MFEKDAQWKFRVMGVDNGTNNLGVCVIEHDLRTGISLVTDAQTFKSDRTAYKRYPERVFSGLKLSARLNRISEWFEEYLNEHGPHAVGIESPFMHVHAHSFASLSIAMDTLKDAILRYRPMIEFIDVPPYQAKQAASDVKLTAKDLKEKDAIRRAISNNSKIVFTKGIRLDDLDEHAVDSIAVARYTAVELS